MHTVLHPARCLPRNIACSIGVAAKSTKAAVAPECRHHHRDPVRQSGCSFHAIIVLRLATCMRLRRLLQRHMPVRL